MFVRAALICTERTTPTSAKLLHEQRSKAAAEAAVTEAAAVTVWAAAEAAVTDNVQSFAGQNGLQSFWYVEKAYY